MAFIWLWARPDFLHFYLGLLVISHVTTILLQYCAWRWRQGEIYFKSGKYIDNTVSCMLYWGNWGCKKNRKRTQMSLCLGLYSINRDTLIQHLGDPWKRKAQKNGRASISSVLTVLAHKQHQPWRLQGGYLPQLPDGQAACKTVHELLHFVASLLKANQKLCHVTLPCLYAALGLPRHLGNGPWSSSPNSNPNVICPFSQLLPSWWCNRW